MRLIDADAFAEFLKDAVKQQKYEDTKIDGLLTVADVIEAVISELDGTSLDGFKNAPTIEPEQRWIPCSERMPKEYGEYRITWTTSASKKRFIGDSEFEVTSEWDSEHYRFKGEWLLDEYIKNYPDVKVIAWKPLEEPWEGEQP